MRLSKTALLIGLGTLLLAVPGLLALRAYRSERSSFISRPHAPGLSLAELGLPGARAVAFQGPAGITLKGYYSPSSNGAAIVVTHGSGGERSNMVDEMRILSRAGFGVLAFDWPGHGESTGQIRWGQPERLALQSALDFLSIQPDVDRERLGAFGFSMGGYVVTQVASFDRRLRAVAIASSPHEPTEHTRWEYRRFGFVTQWPALLAIRVSGMPMSELVPEQVIGKIAPRPVLLISGTADQVVPRWITDRLYAAAGPNAHLLSVPDAGHGRYAEAAPAVYASALTSFFSVLSASASP